MKGSKVLDGKPRARDSSPLVRGGDGAAVAPSIEGGGGQIPCGEGSSSPTFKAMMARVDLLEKAEAATAVAVVPLVGYYDRMEGRMRDMKKKNRRLPTGMEVFASSSSKSGGSTTKSDGSEAHALAADEDGADDDSPPTFHMDLD